jgi:membrane protease YdiL (CAAX protease family)
MMDGLAIVIEAAMAALFSGLAAWLLQRRMPNLHPIGTAMIAVALLILLVILGAGFAAFRQLVDIGAAGHADIDGPGTLFAATIIYGILAVILVSVIGLPVALVTAFRTRRRNARN